MTIDLTLIHHCTTESEEQAKQWVGPGGTTRKRAKTQKSVAKVMP